MIIDVFHPSLIPPIKGGKPRTYQLEIPKSRFEVMFIERKLNKAQERAGDL